MNTECLQYTYTRLSIQCKSLISVDFAAKRTRNLGMYWPILAILLPSYALFRRGCAEQETRICLPVPAVPVQDILQEKNGKLVILWIDFREDIFPVHFYSESESNSLKSIQRVTNFPAFFLPEFLYRQCRNRNTNSCFLFRSPPTWYICWPARKNSFCTPCKARQSIIPSWPLSCCCDMVTQ